MQNVALKFPLSVLGLIRHRAAGLHIDSQLGLLESQVLVLNNRTFYCKDFTSF